MPENDSPRALLLRSHAAGVTTLTMNNPRRLNGWTRPMLDALFKGLEAEAANPETRALILTGADPYYSAGVNLSGALEFGHPKKVHAFIVEHNQRLFDAFIDFPKPFLIAANGPAIGACVTSATLCDAILASDKATFSTPFAKLGVTPEGCSSVHFPRLMGEANAARMLGEEGWVPSAEEALEAGLIDEVVPHDRLLAEAQALAEAWVAEGRSRSYRGGATAAELKRVNAEESQRLASAFLDTPFLDGQLRFLWRKRKLGPAAMFLALRVSRPLWARML